MRKSKAKKVDYQGKGRYRVLVEKAGNRGEPYYFVSRELKFFAVLPQPDGTITVTAVRPGPKEIQELSSIGAKIEGTLSVSVANGVQVVRHNAESEPMFFGLIGAYKWQIKEPRKNNFTFAYLAPWRRHSCLPRPDSSGRLPYVHQSASR